MSVVLSRALTGGFQVASFRKLSHTQAAQYQARVTPQFFSKTTFGADAGLCGRELCACAFIRRLARLSHRTFWVAGGLNHHTSLTTGAHLARPLLTHVLRTHSSRLISILLGFRPQHKRRGWPFPVLTCLDRWFVPLAICLMLMGLAVAHAFTLDSICPSVYLLWLRPSKCSPHSSTPASTLN